MAYTYSKAETTHKEWNNDIFDWTYGRPGVRGFHPSTLVDKHRLVVAGLFFLSDAKLVQMPIDKRCQSFRVGGIFFLLHMLLPPVS